MPNTEEGLIFGDFTAEEWEKYFSNSASQIGNSPAVEFLFDLEYSDHEDPDKTFEAGESETQSSSIDSSGTKNVTTGLEDSGVEVGQESEQENTPGNAVKATVDAGNSVDNLPNEKQKQEPAPSRSNAEHIVFGGKSIVEEPDNETKKSKSVSPPTAVSPDVDSFPPLSSTLTEKPGEKPENERSRKRRKRRRQRKRSGSVSSSSSECSEKERSSNSPGSNAKSKTNGSLLTTEKVKVDKDNTKAHGLCSSHKNQTDSNNHSTNKEIHVASPRNSTSSCDGKTVSDRKSSSSTDGTSASPIQSDTDVKITSDTSQDSCSLDKNNKSSEVEKINAELGTSVDQCKISSNANQEVTEKKEPQKPLSWADLFKGNSKSSPGIVIKTQSPVLRTESPSVLGSKKTEDPGIQTVVGVEEDKYAKKFAETIQKQELDYSQKPFIPRGLTNRGNWCYINATLQALVGCSPFFNLLRKLPFIKDRGPTSTPILDSLVNYMNEFKELSAKPANAITTPKADFHVGEPFEPSCVYKMLSTIQSSLSAKGRQEDAQEFLSCILNGMHEEMLQLSKMVSVPVSEETEVLTQAENSAHDGEQTPDIQEDDGDWEQVGPRNKSMVTRMAAYPQSLISDIFGGFLRSSVHQTGLKDSANVEPFFELQLDVQTVTSVEEALKNLALKEEVQGYTCTKTKVQVDVSRRVTLEGLPKVLILHLKRFIYSKSGSQKLQKVIDYPLELSMGKELLSSNMKNKYSAAQKTYKLFAVVYHHGKNAWGGHYTSDVCHPVHGWIRADDTRLKIVPLSYVLKPTQGKDPYMLFYRRTDLMP